MPKEQIWGSVVTVRDGDLPVMAARTRGDLTQLDLPTSRPGDPTEPTDLLRRRYQLLAAFVDSLDESPSVRRLRDELRALTLEHRAATPVTPAPDVRDARSDPERRLQQTVTVQWGRDEGEVQLFTAAHDHDLGEPVDLGGHWVALDWVATNRLVRKLIVARDQSCGTPA